MSALNPTVDRWVRSAREAPDEFWAEAANELPWFRKWDSVFEWDSPSFRWFSGAQTNLAYNCLDHHVAKPGAGGNGDLGGAGALLARRRLGQPLCTGTRNRLGHRVALFPAVEAVTAQRAFGEDNQPGAVSGGSIEIFQNSAQVVRTVKNLHVHLDGCNFHGFLLESPDQLGH